MKKQGRPKGSVKFSWNEDQSKRVEKMALIGCTDDHIALIENMSERTMKNLYGVELQRGRAKGIGAVAQTLYQMALSGKTPAATFFFLKCRARWKEVHHVEHSGPDGKPIETKEQITYTTSWRKLDGEKG